MEGLLPSLPGIAILKGMTDMASPLRSLLASGTKLWLDSIDPDLVEKNLKLGATGATSNPVIVSNLLKTGRFDAQIEQLVHQGLDDKAVAWRMTDRLVEQAQKAFLPIWQQTGGDDGYVSFELDPLLEDPELALPHDERVAQYIELGRKWSEGHDNRMIKVPATPAGLDSIDELVALGVTINTTLIFTLRQYHKAREAVWRGAQRRASLDRLKSVFSIFVSRIDVYTREHVPQLSPEAQGLVGIVNAKRMWLENQRFWQERPTPLSQEIIFASTGTKDPNDPPWKYVEAFAGSDIETNPPATNDAVESSGRVLDRQVDKLPPPETLREIDREVDFIQLERILLEEGIQKFADPQKALLALIAEKRAALSTRA